MLYKYLISSIWNDEGQAVSTASSTCQLPPPSQQNPFTLTEKVEKARSVSVTVQSQKFVVKSLHPFSAVGAQFLADYLLS